MLSPTRMLSTFPPRIYPLKFYAFFKVNFKCPAHSWHLFFISSSEHYFSSFNCNCILFVHLLPWFLPCFSVCLTLLLSWNCKLQESKSCVLFTFVSLAPPSTQKESVCNHWIELVLSLTNTNTQIIHFEIRSPTCPRTGIASPTRFYGHSPVPSQILDPK